MKTLFWLTGPEGVAGKARQLECESGQAGQEQTEGQKQTDHTPPQRKQKEQEVRLDYKSQGLHQRHTLLSKTPKGSTIV